MRQKKLVIGLLVMLALAVSGFTYAYWAGTITGNNDTAVGTITIGEGGTVSTTVSVDNLGLNSAGLVPTAYVVTAGDDYVDLTFSVLWDGTGATGASSTLSVSSVVYALTGLTSAEIDAMFSYSVQSGTGAIVAGTAQDVVIRVTFDTEPSTIAIYDLVATKTLSLTFTFTVADVS
jgi:hypothetical protein